MATGIGLSLLAALLFAIGNILEKRAVDGMSSLSLRHLGASIGQIRKSPSWAIGASASLIGSVVQILAFHYVSISIMQSVSIAGVVFVVVASRVHFHESLGPLESLGVTICIVAILMTVLSLKGGGTAPGNNANDASVMFVYFATAAVVAFLVMNKRLQNRARNFVFSVSAGLMYGLVGLSNKGIATLLGNNHSKSAELVAIATSPYFYLMILAWALALALFQIGLQRGRVGIIVPFAGAISVIFVAAVGTPLFGESLPRGGGEIALRVVGFVGVLVGSLLLSMGEANKPATI